MHVHYSKKKTNFELISASSVCGIDSYMLFFWLAGYFAKVLFKFLPKSYVFIFGLLETSLTINFAMVLVLLTI